MFVVKRSKHNPILEPDRDHYWEAFATFNLSPIKHGRTYYGLYRAMSAVDKLASPNQMSIIGLAKSQDGAHFEAAERKQFIVPEEMWEKYGCEDPRATFFEGKYYIFYTALALYPFQPDGIRVAVAISDDLNKVTERHLVTPFNAKAMTLFPERINGKVTVIFTAHTDSPPSHIAIAQADNIEDFWSPEFWDKWHAEIGSHILDPRRSDSDHCEVGAVPIKTEAGWLFIYSHIQNYFPSAENFERVFGIEALLLDLNDPTKIVGRTRGPLLTPEESYERHGYVGNIVFPSGAYVEKDTLFIYYGAADTTACRAKVNLTDLLNSIDPAFSERWHFKRYAGNPILSPDPRHPWEAKGAFNPAALDLGGKVHLLYRALSNDNTSTIGYAASDDALTISERGLEPIYVPREDFEMKKIADGNSGCEDPRLTKIGKQIYMCYTAYDSIGPPRVAITDISEKDFLAQNWKWSKPILITPKDVDDKDTCLFPTKIGGKYFLFHRMGTDICGDDLSSLNFEKEKVNKCIMVFGPKPGSWDSGKVGISAPPIKTKKGWILLYHASSHNHHVYRVGAVLLDLKDPTIVLARSTDSIFEPVEQYEKEGIVPNVVFPCGLTVREGLIYIYYGGADKVVGVATMELDVLIEALDHGSKL